MHYEYLVTMAIAELIFFAIHRLSLDFLRYLRDTTFNKDLSNSYIILFYHFLSKIGTILGGLLLSMQKLIFLKVPDSTIRRRQWTR